MSKPPEIPASGGSYTRKPDGSGLKQVEATKPPPAVQAPAAEPTPDAPAKSKES